MFFKYIRTCICENMRKFSINEDDLIIELQNESQADEIINSVECEEAESDAI